VRRIVLILLLTGAAASCADRDGTGDVPPDTIGGGQGPRGASDDGALFARPIFADAPLAVDAREEIEIARAAAVAAPRSAPAWFALAARLDANGLPRLALGAYGRAEELAPADPRAPYHAARMLDELGAPSDALGALERSIAVEPGYAPARRRQGELLLALGRPAEARAAFARALAIDPRDAGARLGDARACLELGDPAEALASLDLVFARGEPSLARHLRAAALRELGRDDEAARDAARAAGQTSAPAWNDPWEREVRALRGGPRMRLARARALTGAGRADEALALLGGDDLAALVASEDVGAIGVAAAALCALARFDAARRLVVDAEARMPLHNRVPLVASEVHAAAGDLDAAVAAARRAIALQPALAAAHGQLAVLLAARGDASGAAAARAEAARLAGLAQDPAAPDEEGER
jgi:tetratricopeptide (TPR) repeat protein